MISSKHAKVLLGIGVLLIGVSFACFMGSSDLQGRISNPGAIAYSLFSAQATAQLQELRSQAQMLQYGGMAALVVGGVFLAVGLIGILRK